MESSEIEVFCAVAINSSLSAAARQLNVSPMTVTRRLASLERDLGLRLVQRTTRSASLTPEGETFLPFAQSMMQAVSGARVALQSGDGTVSGLLRVTAPTVFGQSVIMPLIPDLLRQNPELKIDLTLSDSIVDIVASGIDVAIRIATNRDSNLVARTLASNPRVLCASVDYLENRGNPSSFAQLRQHACIPLHGMPYWSFTLGIEGVTHRPQAAFSANSVDAVRAAARAGLGLCMLTYWDVREDLARGSLVQVQLQDAMPEDLSITAILPTRQHIHPRVRVFLACLEAVLGASAKQNPACQP